MKSLAVSLAFAALAACPIAVTHAASTDSRRTETVPFGDLDLSNQAGAATLFHRVRSAAADVCSQPSGGDYYTALVYKRCVDSAMGDAVSAVDRPTVTTYAQGRGVSIKNAHSN